MSASLINLNSSNVISTTNLAQNNAVTNQHDFNYLNQAALPKAIKMLSGINPIDARCIERILGNPLAEKRQDLNLLNLEQR